jgi:hypothetical protein
VGSKRQCVVRPLSILVQSWVMDRFGVGIGFRVMRDASHLAPVMEKAGAMREPRKLSTPMGIDENPWIWRSCSCSLSCILYSHPVNTSTLTIRLPMEQREALRRSAKALKKTESELIRDLLARDLDVRTLGKRVGHLAGSIDSRKRTSRRADSFRETIRRHNWRPN